MNLVNTISQFDNKHIFLCDPIKNNIMNDGNFIRILYSTPEYTLNGVYLMVHFNDLTCDKFYNKYKCNFNIANHKDIIEQLKSIEETLLKKYNTNKIPSYKIYEQVKCGFIKIFTDVGIRQNCSFILKISGIWETQTNYGLTYKFIRVD